MDTTTITPPEGFIEQGVDGTRPPEGFVEQTAAKVAAPEGFEEVSADPRQDYLAQVAKNTSDLLSKGHRAGNVLLKLRREMGDSPDDEAFQAAITAAKDWKSKYYATPEGQREQLKDPGGLDGEHGEGASPGLVPTLINGLKAGASIPAVVASKLPGGSIDAQDAATWNVIKQSTANTATGLARQGANALDSVGDYFSKRILGRKGPTPEERASRELDDELSYAHGQWALEQAAQGKANADIAAGLPGGTEKVGAEETPADIAKREGTTVDPDVSMGGAFWDPVQNAEFALVGGVAGNAAGKLLKGAKAAAGSAISSAKASAVAAGAEEAARAAEQAAVARGVKEGLSREAIQETAKAAGESARASAIRTAEEQAAFEASKATSSAAVPPTRGAVSGAMSAGGKVLSAAGDYAGRHTLATSALLAGIPLGSKILSGNASGSDVGNALGHFAMGVVANKVAAPLMRGGGAALTGAGNSVRNSSGPMANAFDYFAGRGGAAVKRAATGYAVAGLADPNFDYRTPEEQDAARSTMAKFGAIHGLIAGEGGSRPTPRKPATLGDGIPTLIADEIIPPERRALDYTPTHQRFTMGDGTEPITSYPPKVVGEGRTVPIGEIEIENARRQRALPNAEPQMLLADVDPVSPEPKASEPAPVAPEPVAPRDQAAINDAIGTLVSLGYGKRVATDLVAKTTARDAGNIVREALGGKPLVAEDPATAILSKPEPTTEPVKPDQAKVPDVVSEDIDAQAQQDASQGPVPTALPVESPAVRYEEVPLTDLKLSKDVPQFKRGANAKGVVTPLAGKYQRDPKQPIMVWEREDGTKEIISGRHRFDLAQRSGEESIPAGIWKESDGYTADDMRMLDAAANIRDKQGAVTDYATFFRKNGISREVAEEQGLLNAKGRAGFEIGQNGGDDLYAATVAGKIPVDKAAAIAEAAPKNADLQRLGIAKAGDMTPAELKGYLGHIGETATNETQGDLFGAGDAALQKSEALAREAARRIKELKDQLAVNKALLTKGKAAKSERISAEDPNSPAKRVPELEAQIAQLGEFWKHADILTQLEDAVGGKPDGSVEPAPNRQAKSTVDAPIADEHKPGERPSYVVLEKEARNIIDNAKTRDELYVAYDKLEGLAKLGDGTGRAPLEIMEDPNWEYAHLLGAFEKKKNLLWKKWLMTQPEPKTLDANKHTK